MEKAPKRVRQLTIHYTRVDGTTELRLASDGFGASLLRCVIVEGEAVTASDCLLADLMKDYVAELDNDEDEADTAFDTTSGFEFGALEGADGRGDLRPPDWGTDAGTENPDAGTENQDDQLDSDAIQMGQHVMVSAHTRAGSSVIQHIRTLQGKFEDSTTQA